MLNWSPRKCDYCTRPATARETSIYPTRTSVIYACVEHSTPWAINRALGDGAGSLGYEDLTK